MPWLLEWDSLGQKQQFDQRLLRILLKLLLVSVRQGPEVKEHVVPSSMTPSLTFETGSLIKLTAH